MAKGLRSKIKRHFRSVKRETVEQAPWKLEAERKQQEALDAIRAAPRPSELAAAGGGSGAADVAGPLSMAVDAAAGGAPEGGGAAPMEGGGGEGGGGEGGGGEGATAGGAKALKRLRKQRLLKVKGIAKGHRKRSNPLAGGKNAFHKRRGKKRR
eukprot:scaffold2.g7492.t1